MSDWPPSGLDTWSVMVNTEDEYQLHLLYITQFNAVGRTDFIKTFLFFFNEKKKI